MPTTNETTRTATFTNRSFGVEIEYVGATMDAVAAAVRLAGVAIEVEGYNHTTRSAWKIVPDGSVCDAHGRGQGEVVSPVLSGLEGLRTLRRVLSAIVSVGGTVNRTCGLHVHVGASDLDGVSAARLVLDWERAEDLGVRSTMAPSRRDPNYGGACFYAKRSDEATLRLARNVLAGTARASSLLDFARVAGERYRGLNVQAFVRHSTVEFRAHQGSVDADKVAAWVVACVRFVESAKDGGIARSSARRSSGSAKGQFLHLLVRLGLKAYSRDGYAQIDDLCAWAGSYLAARRAHFAGEQVPAVRKSIAAILGDAAQVAQAA